MRDVNSSSQELSAVAAAGPPLLAIGLGVLIAAAWIPALPVLTAMSVLTLGATCSTLARLRQSPAFLCVLMLHAATYATLYALFVGATLQLGASRTGPQIGFLLGLDLVLSWLFLAIAARQIAMAFRRT